MTDTTNHIAVLCSRLDMPGGIERATVNIANLFACKGHKVSLLILDESAISFYKLNPLIQILNSNLHFGITEGGNKFLRKVAFVNDLIQLRKLLKSLQADTVIATEYPFAIAAILCGGKKYSKIISWEHHHFYWLKKNKFWTKLFNYTYPKLDTIVCLNNEEKKYYDALAPVTVIPNYVENNKKKYSNLNHQTILSVGWLIPRKGIDLLLSVAKKILTHFPDWTWEIIGEGEMKQTLLDFIQHENLTGKLILKEPLNNDLSDEYCNASFFALTSRFEAFPMVLLEAMSHGLPCISFDCPSGPSEIIMSEIDGLLVERENIEAMFQAIKTLIEDKEKRIKMGIAAQANIKRFYPDRIYMLWEKLIVKEKK